MKQSSIRRWVVGAAAVLCLSLASAAQAQDFFSQLFGGFGRSRGPAIRMPFDDGPPVQRSPKAGAMAAAVRRFACGPAMAGISRSRYRTIRAAPRPAAALSGERYQGCLRQQHRRCLDRQRQALHGIAERVPLPHELVSGCTCNGKDALGLAQVKIEDDPTLRKGDIVAGENGILVAGRPDKRGAELNLSPVPDRIKSRYHARPWWRGENRGIKGQELVEC